MADTVSKPNNVTTDPANDGSLTGAFNEILKNFLMQVDDMLPAKVIAYDRVANVATVHPQMMMVTTDGQQITRAQYASIPVFAFGGGGIGINFPLQAGDTGWIKANDRDISLYIQAMAENEPNTARFHKFQDGMFFPDVLRKLIIDGEDEDAMVIQLLDNTSKIAVHRSGNVVVRADQSRLTMLPDGTVTLDAPTSVTITTPSFTVDAAQSTFTGDVQVDGTLHADVDVVSDTVSGKTHTHGGVQVGGGNTAAPNP